MGRIIAVVNQKGGVGKTTTAVNLSAALAMAGQRILLIDSDAQCSASSGFGIRVEPGEPSTYEVLLGQASIDRAIRRTMLPQLELIPASHDLIGAEIELVSLPERETRLRTALELPRWRYDYILIDCPPSLGLATLNALAASDSVLIPLQCEYYALEGLQALLANVSRVRESLNRELVIEGLLLTMFDARNSLSRQVAEDVKTHFVDQVFATVVPRNVRLSESPSHGLPVLLYDPNSKGALAYSELAQEMIRRRVGAASENKIAFWKAGSGS